mmetsp:Transcript_33864/g.106994  ORF Transcript_33864/g.106994 Transcript_33864/m.106994 type:complete len:328 (+) Transcript_33864:1893-2876(+)
MQVAVARVLVHAAVDDGVVETSRVEQLVQHLAVVPRRREDDGHVIRGNHLAQQEEQRAELFAGAQREEGQPQLVAHLVLHVEADEVRVLETSARELHELRRQRRREEQHLPRLGAAAQNLVQLLGEAHLEEPVGLIEDADLNALQRERSDLLEVVHEPPRRGHDEVRRRRERLELCVHAVATREQRSAQAHVPPHLLRETLGLHGELARGAQDEPARPGGDRVLLQAVEHRDEERRRLARAGTRHADHVLAAQRHRQRLALHRRGRAVHAHHAAQQRRVQVQGLEGPARVLVPQRRRHGGSAFLPRLARLSLARRWAPPRPPRPPLR